ncbi:hypothetical protein MUP77_10870 [Candidatus Bathyarchaeota archaeon]|nr:hypothetical protein [Candidatus Bathyarchaeota archaeon]
MTLREIEPCRMTVKSLFLDYDGTISPRNVSRSESEVSAGTFEVLLQISKEIPIAIVTSKDIWFVMPRTPFARAWSTICGLEARVGASVITTPVSANSLERLYGALELAKRGLIRFGVDIEEKRNSCEQTVAFCVDWSQSKDKEMAKREVDLFSFRCKALGLTIFKIEGAPFVDVYPVHVDKGLAVEKLRRALGLEGGLLFLGDSEMDNPAFMTSDAGLVVVHDETRLERLAADYFVRFKEVEGFLKKLLDNGLAFDSNLSGVKPNLWRMKPSE